MLMTSRLLLLPVRLAFGDEAVGEAAEDPSAECTRKPPSREERSPRSDGDTDKEGEADRASDRKKERKPPGLY